jgi:hypothetical protein
MSSSVWQAMSVDGVLEDTGMEEEVLDYIFNKYADRIFEHTSPDDMPSYLMISLCAMCISTSYSYTCTRIPKLVNSKGRCG